MHISVFAVVAAFHFGCCLLIGIDDRWSYLAAEMTLKYVSNYAPNDVDVDINVE